MTKQEEIKNFMDKLGITEQEALELWEDDHSTEVREEVKEIEKKAKAVKHYEKSATAKKRKPPTRKEDTEKIEIIKSIFEKVKNDFENVTISNPTQKIDFVFNNQNFTISLCRHRTKE